MPTHATLCASPLHTRTPFAKPVTLSLVNNENVNEYTRAEIEHYGPCGWQHDLELQFALAIDKHFADVVAGRCGQ